MYENSVSKNIASKIPTSPRATPTNGSSSNLSQTPVMQATPRKTTISTMSPRGGIQIMFPTSESPITQPRRALEKSPTVSGSTSNTSNSARDDQNISITSPTPTRKPLTKSQTISSNSSFQKKSGLNEIPKLSLNQMITQANDISSTDDILTQEEFLASLQKAVLTQTPSSSDRSSESHSEKTPRMSVGKKKLSRENSTASSDEEKKTSPRKSKKLTLKRRNTFDAKAPQEDSVSSPSKTLKRGKTLDSKAPQSNSLPIMNVLFEQLSGEQKMKFVSLINSARYPSFDIQEKKTLLNIKVLNFFEKTGKFPSIDEIRAMNKTAELST